MNIVKSKLRNRMSAETMNSIIMIRHQLRMLKQSWHTYELSENVLDKITKTVKKGTAAGVGSSSASGGDDDHEDVVELFNYVNFST